MIFLQCFWLLLSHSEVSSSLPDAKKWGVQNNLLLASLAGCTPTFKNMAPSLFSSTWT